MHVRIRDGNIPDHENDICKFMLHLFKFQKQKN